MSYRETQPDEILDRLRTEADWTVELASTATEVAVRRALAVMADRFRQLDDHLTNGGFPPAAWPLRPLDAIASIIEP